MNQEVNVHISATVLKDVSDERFRQDSKWGEQNHDHFKWMTIIGEEFGESCQSALDAAFAKNAGDFRKANQHELELRQELVEVAACAIAAIESLDRRWSNPTKDLTDLKG